MRYSRRWWRLLQINFILIRYNLDELIVSTSWFSPFRYIVLFNPYYWRRKKSSRAVNARLALQALGPIFVKVGQILSTRRDLLPDDIANELAKLQDQVSPFSGVLAQQIVAAAYPEGMHQVFSEFNQTALASASIAQVHAAKLVTGENVVIKILRPNIEKIIESDIDLLLTLATFFEKHWRSSKHLKPREIILEIAQTLIDELDLLREGANASQLKRNFKHSTELYIPKIYWPHSRINLLVMERIYGIPIYDFAQLDAAGVNRKKLAECCINVFFAQAFRDSFFHADLHPGNLFVDASNPEEPRILAVDFGIVGSLSQQDQRYLAENMVAFFKRDYQRVAELHIACGWLPPDTRVDQFEGAVRSVSEPIFERPFREVSFGQLLMRLFQVAQRFHINIQPQLVLLQKTILNIEGLSRQIDPDLDLWAYAAPQIERWLKKQMGARAFIKQLRDQLPLWSDQLPALPSLLYEVLSEKKAMLAKSRFEEKKIYRKKSQNFFYVICLAAGAGALFIIQHLNL